MVGDTFLYWVKTEEKLHLYYRRSDGFWKEVLSGKQGEHSSVTLKQIKAAKYTTGILVLKELCEWD